MHIFCSSSGMDSTKNVGSSGEEHNECYHGLDLGFVKESLDKVTQLTEIDSQNDPEDEPYLSKYAARTILERLKKSVNRALETVADNQSTDCVADEVLSESSSVLSENDHEVAANNAVNVLNQRQKTELFLRYIEGLLAENYISCEETSTGQEHLENALNILEHKFSFIHPCTVLLSVRLLNQSAILHASRSNLKLSEEFLLKAEQLYHQYKKRFAYAPYRPADLLTSTNVAVELCDDKEKWLEFEAEHTQTLYYLAQVYQKLDDRHLSAKYCQYTLKRQLELGPLDHINWALNAATLSQYFMIEREFTLARHYLASALKMLESAGYSTDMAFCSEEGTVYNKMIDIKRCWIKYGLALLEESWNQLNANEQSDGEEANREYLFDLELTFYENWMTDRYVKSFDEAKQIFLKVQTFIKEGLNFYVLDGFCTDHVELTQDYSRLFKELTKFEPTYDRKCKMSKRRIDMLENIICQISPQHYLLICRQLVYELAEVYSDMVGYKLAIASQPGSTSSQQAMDKISQLCSSGIKNYNRYITSLENHEGNLPDPLPEGTERPTLVAWFCMADLYRKMKVTDKEQLITNYYQALHYYKLIVENCNKHPRYAELMAQELSLCQEMTELLPKTIDRISSS